MKSVGIIGAGASGLSAANALVKRGIPVKIFDKKEQAGKKLSATGNGHGNFTNTRMDASCYHADRAFMEHFLKRFSEEDCKRMFLDLGMLSLDREGYLYPASFQAAALTSVLTENLKDDLTEWHLNTRVRDIQKLKDSFLISTDQGDFTADYLILALGSSSGVRDKYPFNAYEMLGRLGIPVTKTFPSLVFLNGKEGFEKVWSGVRMKASVSYKGETETGEIQFREDGISGIPVFQISSSVIRDEEKVKEVTLDLLPDYQEAFLEKCLKEEERALPVQDYLRGWIPRKMITPVLKKAGIFEKKTLPELSDKDRQDLIRSLKHFTYRITGHGDFSDSQVTSGGVCLSEITEFFESVRIPGLYITGELLDVDGRCGGYNLHFAFGSGKIAGEHIPGDSI